MVLAACSGSSTTTTAAVAPPASTSATTPPAVATTTSEPVSTTTTVEEPEVLLPANDVEDPTEAIVAIYDYLVFLHTIPEQGPGFLGLIYLDTCECYNQVIEFLATYASNGWVQDDQGIEVTDVFVSQKFDNGDVLLQVTDTWSPQLVRNGEGELIRLAEDEWIAEVSLVGLERGDDGRWRVGVIGVVGEVVP
jgi:hypothetical protein